MFTDPLKKIPPEAAERILHDLDELESAGEEASSVVSAAAHEYVLDFCTNCGARLDAPAAKERAVCPVCATP